MNRSRRLATIKKSESNSLKAKRQLHPNYLEADLKCREKEYLDIFNFIKNSLIESVGGCMFISGVPGTGKTATVHRVIKNLFNDDQLKPLEDKIKKIEINGLKLSDPNQFYSHFYYTLFGEKLSKQKAIDELEDYFTSSKPSDKFIILVVDELDQLCTRKQNILYHLFDWPNRKGSKLIILSIANTMDLPERVMMTKIQSRLGLRRLPFQAYKFKELIQIVEARIGDLDIFDLDAIELISRKVAAITGDARRVLDLCRRSIDIAEQEKFINNDKSELFVTLKHVKLALKEVFSSDKIYAIADTSEQERIFLQSIIKDFKIGNKEETTFEEVYLHHIENCRFNKIYVPTTSELLDIGNNLYKKRVIFIEKNRLDIKTKINLNVSIDEIEYVFK